MKHGSLKPDKYISRTIDKEMMSLLETFAAIEISGTMWCGKTWTAMSFAESVTRIGLDNVRIAAEADPSTALLGKQPHVIDEWQDVPAIWDEVRMNVDSTSGKPGQYILTGSSDPQKEKVHHSGAGRIARVSMTTMSLQETGESSGEVSLRGLFEGEFTPALVQQRLDPLAEIICRGGWPQLVSNGNDSVEAQTFLASYFDALTEISIPRKNLKGSEAVKVLGSIARNAGGAVTYNTIAADAGFTEVDAKTASNKVSLYIDALEKLYTIVPVSGWDAPIRSKSRLRTKPKYYLADPSMVAFLLGINAKRLLTEGQLFGTLFENLCMHDLGVYARALPDSSPNPLYYYRDSDGLEVDAIVELRDGRWAAFEIKLGENKIPDAARNLNRLANKIGLNPAARNPEPEFLAVIVGAGEYARYDKEQGVYVIPITSLGV